MSGSRMQDKVVVITGSNTGIGEETAVGVADMGATTVLACRNLDKAGAAQAEIKQRTGNDDVHVVALDLSDFASIRRAAAEVLERWDRIDVLVNNAGGMWSERHETKQGFEQTFGVNHLGPFLFTELLLERIKASVPARIVNLSSVGHHAARGGMRWADLQSTRRYGTMDAYGQSKLANVLFTRELARRLDASGVTANCCHPGPVRSGFGMDGDMKGIIGFGNKLIRPFEISAASGAKTSIYLAASLDVEGKTGGYYVRSKPGHMSKRGHSDADAAKLWDVSERLIAEADTAAAP